MINSVKEVLKSNIQHLISFYIYINAWNTIKPVVHLQAVMRCFYRRNKFMSLLLDSLPINSIYTGKGDQRSKSILSMDYGIEDRTVFITSDGAHSNLKAYGNNHAESNSHKLKNLLRHVIWAASYPKAKKEIRHGLSWKESNTIANHFEYLGKIEIFKLFI